MIYNNICAETEDQNTNTKYTQLCLECSKMHPYTFSPSLYNQQPRQNYDLQSSTKYAGGYGAAITFYECILDTRNVHWCVIMSIFISPLQ